MKIAFPVMEDRGLESPVFDHFGSAKSFIVVDSENDQAKTIENKDLHHSHGSCQPTLALGGEPVDAIVSGGMGKGALMKLNQAGIKVFRGVQGSVSENLNMAKAGKLPEFLAEHTCSGDHEHGCAH